MKIFRMMMAFTAAFDLDTVHLDSVKAYLNAELNNDEESYVGCPPRFSSGCRKLRKALYGLPRSAALWPEALTKSMKEISMRQLLEERCVFADGKIIIFFYVDDIALLARKEDCPSLQKRRNQLKHIYEMRDMGDLNGS